MKANFDSGNTSRAPLGNKTTNAKARAAQNTGVKDIVRDIEKTRLGPTTVQKPKQRLAPLVPSFEVQADKDHSPEDDEPEYAPPNPQPLPYESDVLPSGGLSMEGLKRKNLFKGYYNNFHNPLDRDGTSRLDRRFQREMEQVTQEAIKQNDEFLGSLNWGVDISPQKPSARKSNQPKPNSGHVNAAATQQLRRQATTVNARRAASALSQQPARSRSTFSKSAAPNALPKRPVSSISKPLSNVDGVATTSPGEAASRTTIGYNKGRAASHMIYGPHKQRTNHALPDHSKSLAPDHNLDAKLTATEPSSRPQFASIFYDDNAEELAPFDSPSFSASEDEDEFELKLDV